MRLDKGLRRDENVNEQPSGSPRYVRNGVYTNSFKSIQNEASTSSIHTLDYRVNGIRPTSNSTIIFSTNDTNSEIGILDSNGDYTKKIRSAYLGFSMDYPIQAEYKYNNLNELVVTWTDDNTEPKILNLDNLPFTLDGDYELLSSDEIKYANLYISGKIPNYNLDSVNDIDGNLYSGVYYVTGKYMLEDGAYTNWLNLSNAITISDSSKTDKWENYDGCPANTSTSKSISLNITNLDNDYDTIKIAVLYKNTGNIEVYDYNDYSVSNNLNITISDLSDKTALTVDDILVNSIHYTKAGTITALKNDLLMGNVEVRDNIKYQKFANNIEVRFVCKATINLDSIKDSYNDELVIYNSKGFFPNEVYALGIRFWTDDNNPTKVFSIPGRKANSTDLNDGNSSALNIYSDAKKFHFEDTANVINNESGQMGYWQNLNEFYPNETDDINGEYNGTVDYDGNIITGGIKLNSEHVRHHKFPSIPFLLDNAYDPFPISNETAPSVVQIHFHNPISTELTNTTIGLKFNAFSVSGDNTIGSFESSTKFVFNKACNVEINNYFIFSCEITNPSGITVSAYVELVHNLSVIQSDTAISGNSARVELSGVDTISVIAGDFIEYNLTFTTSDIYINYNDCYYGSGNSEIDSSSLYSTKFAKILGLKLYNIYIPDYIRESYTKYEIVYGKRDLNNTICIGQSSLMCHKSSTGYISTNNNHKKFHAFDIMTNKPSINADYVYAHTIMDNASTDGYNIFNGTTEFSSNPGIGASNIILSPVVKSMYLPANNTATNPSNESSEESLFIELLNDLNNHDITKTYIADLCKLQLNLYENLSNIEYVSTGKLNNINAIDTTFTDYLYGGDAFVNLYGITEMGGLSVTSGSVSAGVRYHLFPCWSSSNIALRHTGITDSTPVTNEIYYPYYNLVDNIKGIGTNFEGNIDTTTDSIWDKIQTLYTYTDLVDMPSYYGYNKDYSSLNDVLFYDTFNYKAITTNKFPFRVVRAISLSSESPMVNWRVFLPDSYKDSVKNRGVIWNLDNDNNDLLVQHKNALLIGTLNDTLNISENVVAELGSSDIFTKDFEEMIYDEVGYVGCQSKFASIRCKVGNIIVDRQQGKVFIYNNRQIDELTKFDYGMREWFNDNLQYSAGSILTEYNYLFDDDEIVQFDDSENVTYATVSEDIGNLYDTDNPFDDVGITTAWDEKYERLIISKKQISGTANTEYSWTLSYYPSTKQWLSFHDYLPRCIYSNRNGLMSINANTIYSHDSETTTCNFYGTDYDFTIDAIFNTPLTINKMFESIIWKTTVQNITSKYIDYDKTFSSLIVYDFNRLSEEIALTTYTFNTGNIRKTSGTWKFNDFRNLNKNTTLEIIRLNEVDELHTSSLVVADKITNWYEKEQFINDFIAVRFIFDSNSDIITVNEVDVNSTPVSR